MRNETDPSQLEPKPIGIRCLELLGFADYIGRDIVVEVDGEPATLLAEDFLEICGKYAIPAFIGLESTSPTDPDYAEGLQEFREMAAHYLGAELPSAPTQEG